MGFDWGAIRAAFFDSEKVRAKVTATRRRVLSRFGAFVRTRARTSIRKRKGSAPAGHPPHSHAGQLRLILFGYDPATDSVVVGPVPFGAKGVGAGVVPRLLEFGGASVDRRGRRTHYPGHPFMKPALDAERPKFTDAFKGSM